MENQELSKRISQLELQLAHLRTEVHDSSEAELSVVVEPSSSDRMPSDQQNLQFQWARILTDRLRSDHNTVFVDFIAYRDDLIWQISAESTYATHQIWGWPYSLRRCDNVNPSKVGNLHPSIRNTVQRSSRYVDTVNRRFESNFNDDRIRPEHLVRWITNNVSTTPLILVPMRSRGLLAFLESFCVRWTSAPRGFEIIKCDDCTKLADVVHQPDEGRPSVYLCVIHARKLTDKQLMTTKLYLPHVLSASYSDQKHQIVLSALDFPTSFSKRAPNHCFWTKSVTGWCDVAAIDTRKKDGRLNANCQQRIDTLNSPRDHQHWIVKLHDVMGLLCSHDRPERSESNLTVLSVLKCIISRFSEEDVFWKTLE